MASQLATLAELKSYLGVFGNDDDDLLSSLLEASAGAMEKWCSRTFAPTDYTLALDGNGRSRIVVDQWPIISVASLTVDGSPIQPSTGPRVPGYIFSGYTVTLRGGLIFDLGQRNVELAFRAGYADIPAELTQACIKIAALRFKRRERLGVSSRSMAGETITYTSDDFPESVERVLNDYKSVVTL